MKIIFLDVDGVLTNRATLTKARRSLDRECVRRLQVVVAVTGAHIVLSSTWRFWMHHVAFDALLREYGFLDYGVVIDRTPKLNVPRGEEIREWLYEARMLGLVIEQCAILDDDLDAGSCLPKNLVRTNTELGLTDEDMDRAIDILGPLR